MDVESLTITLSLGTLLFALAYAFREYQATQRNLKKAKAERRGRQ